jgi:hypothetical protein
MWRGSNPNAHLPVSCALEVWPEHVEGRGAIGQLAALSRDQPARATDADSVA